MKIYMKSLLLLLLIYYYYYYYVAVYFLLFTFVQMSCLLRTCPFTLQIYMSFYGKVHVLLRKVVCVWGYPSCIAQLRYMTSLTGSRRVRDNWRNIVTNVVRQNGLV